MSVLLTPFSEYCETRNKTGIQILNEFRPVAATVPLMIAWYYGNVLDRLANINVITPHMSDRMLEDVMWLHDNNIYHEVVVNHDAILLYSEDDAAMFKLARL